MRRERDKDNNGTGIGIGTIFYLQRLHPTEQQQSKKKELDRPGVIAISHQSNSRDDQAPQTRINTVWTAAVDAGCFQIILQR